MNNNKHTNLQFTELTPNDIAIHEDLYIGLLILGASYDTLGSHHDLYYIYAQKELQKAQGLFHKTFK